MVENIIRSSFGIECNIKKIKPKGLELYITSGREFFSVEVEKTSFLLIKLSSNERFGAIALKKQSEKLKISFGLETVFYFDGLTKLQRDALIKKSIPFIAGEDQIYLPFLGIILRNNFRAEKDVKVDKMSPSTQSLFLYLLYNKHDYVLKKEAAADLGLTRTSITRASAQLKEMGLITEEPCGVEVRMRTVTSGYKLYQAAKDYLISPIQKTIYVNKKDVNDKLLFAGESALSIVTLLSEPKYKTYAVFKGDNLVKNLKEVDVLWQDNDAIIRIELWKYEPSLFSKDGMIDPISLEKSLENNDDERIYGELEKYMEEYEW